MINTIKLQDYPNGLTENVKKEFRLVADLFNFLRAVDNDLSYEGKEPTLDKKIAFYKSLHEANYWDSEVQDEDFYEYLIENAHSINDLKTQ